MKEDVLEKRIKELESELKSCKKELCEITKSKEIEELKKIYELFKEDTFIKVERSESRVIIYHITDKQEIKYNEPLCRYYFTAHYDSVISFDREDKEISTDTYSKKMFLEYDSSPCLKKKYFSVIGKDEIGQLINELTQSILGKN